MSLTGLLGVDDTIEAVSQDANADHLNKVTRKLLINRWSIKKRRIESSRENFSKPWGLADVFRTNHMDEYNFPTILLFRPETDSDVWLKEKQSLSADKDHGANRFGESEEIRGRKRSLVRRQEAIQDGTKAKPGNRLV